MVSTSRRGGGSGDRPSAEEPPAQFASVTPPQTPMMDHSFTLQAIMDLKGSVSSLATSVERLIADVKTQGEKMDIVRHQISFVRGIMWVIGALVTLVTVGLSAAAFYFKFHRSCLIYLVESAPEYRRHRPREIGFASLNPSLRA